MKEHTYILPFCLQSGDDLRQDMLTMQVIRLMEKLWLKDNLDLKMVTFRCQATGLRKGTTEWQCLTRGFMLFCILRKVVVLSPGFIELVTASDTLREIQIKHGRGVVGSFKDNTIRVWLQLHNPTELEYEKVGYYYLKLNSCHVLFHVFSTF